MFSIIGGSGGSRSYSQAGAAGTLYWKSEYRLLTRNVVALPQPPDQPNSVTLIQSCSNYTQCGVNMLVIVSNSRVAFEIDKATNTSKYTVNNLTIESYGMLATNPSVDS